MALNFGQSAKTVEKLIIHNDLDISDGIPSPNIIIDRFAQPANAAPPMRVQLGRITLSRELHDLNAFIPMSLTTDVVMSFSL